MTPNNQSHLKNDGPQNEEVKGNILWNKYSRPVLE